MSLTMPAGAATVLPELSAERSVEMCRLSFRNCPTTIPASAGLLSAPAAGAAVQTDGIAVAAATAAIVHKITNPPLFKLFSAAG